MIFAWGQRFYGKVDAVGNACVRTRFTHFQLLPFAPSASWLMVVGGPCERALSLPLVRGILPRARTPHGLAAGCRARRFGNARVPTCSVDRGPRCYRRR
jgi:hypothetical protein